MSRALVPLSICILLGACATRGDRFNPDLVDRITPGVTTQDDIRRWFGEPLQVRQSASGRTGWGYDYEETQTRSTTSVTKVMRSIASLFRLRYFFPPVDVTYERSSRHALTVVFDQEGVVVDFSYEREVTPTRRVY